MCKRSPLHWLRSPFKGGILVIINELNLIGFGKFEDKQLKFKDGINIIYGENESGKTTIHSFIDGMFYGFLKPNSKTVRYTDELKKYQPWNSKRYAGVMIFSHDGTLYRIEREFNKRNANARVLVENTAEDITQEIDNGEKSKKLQPGLHFFGFNNAVYSNTISTRQLCTKTEDELAEELRDKLVNVSTSLDENISVDNALKELDNRLKSIGSLRAPTSIYCKTNNELIDMENEKEEILGLKDEYYNLLDQSEELNKELHNLEKKLDKERLLLRQVEYREMKNTYAEALRLNEKLDDLKTQLDDLDKFKDYSESDYDNCALIERKIEVKESRIDEINKKIMELEENLSESSDIGLQSIYKDMEEIKKDYLAFEGLEEGKNKLFLSQDSSGLEFLKRDLDSTKAEKNKYIFGGISIFIIYIMLIYLSKVYGYSVVLPQLLVPMVILLVWKTKKIDKSVGKIEEKIRETAINGENRERKIIQIGEEEKIILDKYKLNSKFELRDLYERSQRENYRVEQKYESQEELKNKLNIEVNKKNDLQSEKEDLLNSLNELLLKYGVNTTSEIREGLNKKIKLDEIQIKFYNKKELFNKVLGDYTLEKLENDLNINKEYENDEIISEDIQSKNSIKDSIENLTQSISDTKLDKKGIDEKISLINPKISRLVEIEEEMERCKNILEEFDNKKNAIELAKSTIEELSKDIHNQFAPHINEKVGSMINKITNGKYSAVKIDNKLNISVVDPQIGEVVDIENLSGGTIDQLYFSLRFGIINSMTEDKLPLILDDCFIQYDNNRLNNILNLLIDIKDTRQVILFSCHNREMEALNNLNINYNLITLS